MQKIIMEGLLALSPAEVSELLKHIGLQSFATAFGEAEVPSYQNTDTLLIPSLLCQIHPQDTLRITLTHNAHTHTSTYSVPPVHSPLTHTHRCAFLSRHIAT